MSVAHRNFCGIEGYTTASTAAKVGSAFAHVVNYGVINCAKDTCGHIAGTNLENNPKQWMPAALLCFWNNLKLEIYCVTLRQNLKGIRYEC